MLAASESFPQSVVPHTVDLVLLVSCSRSSAASLNAVKPSTGNAFVHSICRARTGLAHKPPAAITCGAHWSQKYCQMKRRHLLSVRKFKVIHRCQSSFQQDFCFLFHAPYVCVPRDAVQVHPVDRFLSRETLKRLQCLTCRRPVYTLKPRKGLGDKQRKEAAILSRSVGKQSQMSTYVGPNPNPLVLPWRQRTQIQYHSHMVLMNALTVRPFNVHTLKNESEIKQALRTRPSALCREIRCSNQCNGSVTNQTRHGEGKLFDTQASQK